MSIKLRDRDDIRREMRELMAEKRISARQLMEVTGISHVTINGFLRGHVDSYDATIIKLCLHLGLKWDQDQPVVETAA